MSTPTPPKTHITLSPITLTTPNNGLFATAPFPPGAPILSIPTPLVAVAETRHLADVCSGCFVWAQGEQEEEEGGEMKMGRRRLRRCKGCGVVRYCGKSCQTRAWKTAHKYECNLFSNLHPRILPTSVRAAIQFLKRRDAGALSSEQSTALLRMKSHLADFEARGGETWANLCLMAQGAEAYSGVRVGGLDARGLIGRLLINCLTLVTPTFDPVGICLDPLAAMMNHSCDCNAVVSFDKGARINVHSLRAIAQNEEITISYVDTTYPFYRRQAELGERYFFTCNCAFCIQGSTLRQDLFSSANSDTERLQRVEEQAFALLEEAKAMTDYDLANSKLSAGMALLRETRAWPIHRQPYAHLRQRLGLNLLSQRQWVPALAQMLRVYFYVDPILFRESFHPVRVVHTWTLSRLFLQLSHLSVAEPEAVGELEEYGIGYGWIVWGLLREVVGNVDRSHGSQSSFTGSCKRKFEEVETDMSRGEDRVRPGFETLEEQWRRLRRIADELAV